MTHQFTDGMFVAAVAVLGLCQVPISMMGGRLGRNELDAGMTDLSTIAEEVHAVWPRRTHITSRVRQLVSEACEAA